MISGIVPNSNKRSNEQGQENGYPYEKVLFTQGGVRFSYGDEPGKQFIRMVHPSGTIMEIFPDGRIVQTNVGESKIYNKGGVTFTVDENMDVHISGHNNIKVAGGAHIEVAGDAGVAVGGDIGLLGVGKMALNVAGLNIGVRGDLGISVSGSTAIKTGGVTYLESGGDMNVVAGGNINQDGSEMYLNSGAASPAPTDAGVSA